MFLIVYDNKTFFEEMQYKSFKKLLFNSPKFSILFCANRYFFCFSEFFAFLCLLFFLFGLYFCLTETFLMKTFCQHVSDLQLSSKKFFFVCVGLFWRFSERKIKNKKERESCNFPETQRYSSGHSSHISL